MNSVCEIYRLYQRSRASDAVRQLKTMVPSLLNPIIVKGKWVDDHRPNSLPAYFMTNKAYDDIIERLESMKSEKGCDDLSDPGLLVFSEEICGKPGTAFFCYQGFLYVYRFHDETVLRVVNPGFAGTKAGEKRANKIIERAYNAMIECVRRAIEIEQDTSN